jgi:leader peptidase (prepilin peptidase) / N-methyltransferase
MTIVGFCLGFVLDEMISRLAREPFERREADAAAKLADDLDAAAPAPTLDLASEVGQVALPWSLTGGSMVRRVIVVATTAVLFALVGREYAGHVPAMLVVAGYVSVLLICAATDIIAYRVPNVVSYPAIVGALLLGLLWPGADRLSVAGGGLLAGGLFLACALLPGGPMGMGDVKLALFIGFALGFIFVVQAMLVMAITGGIVASLLLVLKLLRVRQVTYMFYAPFISAGAIFVLLAQGAAIHPF